MRSYILRRLLLMVPTLIGISLVCFILIQLLPGGPVEETISRAQFNRELRNVMFDALEEMTNAEGTQSTIAAVDLAQVGSSRGTRLPAYSIRAACSSILLPRTDTRSGSPGPAPTIST